MDELGGTENLSALIIAIVGLVLATASLTWQLVSFLLSGSRVRVGLRRGARDANGNMLHAAPKNWGDGNDMLAKSQGYGIPILAVTVHNRGRMAINVESVSAAGGTWTIDQQSVPNIPLPHRLEPGAGQAGFVDREPLIERFVRQS
jgi:hypothetical protein